LKVESVDAIRMLVYYRSTDAAEWTKSTSGLIREIVNG